MNKDKILQANVLDIIFEHRNKSYGAYTLRKFYNNRLYKAMGIVCMLVLVLCLLSFLQPKEKSLLITTIYDDSGLVAPPKDRESPKPKPPKTRVANTPPVTAVPPTQIYTHVQIAPDPLVTRTIASLDSSQFGTHDIPGKKGITVPVTPVTLGTPGDTSHALIAGVDHTTPTGFAEVMPSYPGGVDALQAFLQKNLENPDELKTGQSVSVRIRFVVGFDGKLKSFETVQDGGAPFNNEVVRVLKKMPQWIPGKTHGENVSVYYVLPVNFISTE